MDTKRTIRKILFITLWVAIGSGMITLLAAAMRKQKNDRCKDYAITIKGDKNNLFVDEKDIFKTLSSGTNGKIKGEAISRIDLGKLEQKLEKNAWVKDAEIYFDNKNVLHVNVTEREPVARVFNTAGKSFYVDKEDNRMPLSEKLSAKVPVFTGFPDRKALLRKDSILLKDIRSTAQFILNDPFWMSQVAQIDINMQREFEMIPLVGNHSVKLGKAGEMDKKFNRLFLFYKNVLSKSGFDKYKMIDVQYSGQVVGIKGTTSKVDSVQLRKNIEKLLQQARDMQLDPSINSVDSKTIADKMATNLDDTPSPNPVKSFSDPKTVNKDRSRPPKAVMPKRE